MGIVHGELRILCAEINGAYTRFSKSHELVISVCVFAPDEQLVKDLVCFIDPAVSIVVLLCQISKTISV